MPKLDVGVGDEFPTEEIRRDEDGVVHHHHYYYRRPRRPFRFLRAVLWIVLVMAALHAMKIVSYDFWDYSFFPWIPQAAFRFTGALVLIVAAGMGLYYLRRTDDQSRP